MTTFAEARGRMRMREIGDNVEILVDGKTVKTVPRAEMGAAIDLVTKNVMDGVDVANPRALDDAFARTPAREMMERGRPAPREEKPPAQVEGRSADDFTKKSAMQMMNEDRAGADAAAAKQRADEEACLRKFKYEKDKKFYDSI